MRQCGECTLCCKLVPVSDGMMVNGQRRPGFHFEKPAGQRCPHQRRTGCNIYERRPLGCRAWSCVWLMDPVSTAKMSRPDRSHYIIDPMKDVIELTDNQTGKKINMAAMQVWCDPKHRDAWKDPALIELIEKMGEDRVTTLVRYSSKDGFVVFPHSITGRGLVTRGSNMSMPERSMTETVELLNQISTGG